ncbi:MAG TPA: peptidylprolyl isomerase [Fimbriimonadaceae bacterium]|nr:peptidylprolyl isomerase [Fimbriimonadaceae bacterium]
MLLQPLLIALALVQGASDVPANLVPAKPDPGKVLVKVNGEEVKASDIEALLWEWSANDVLEDLILYRTVKQEAEKRAVRVEEIAVQQRLAEFLEELKRGLQPGQTLEGLLQRENSAPSRLFIRLKTEMLLQALATKTFTPDQFVKVSTIIFKPDSDRSESVAGAIKKAQDAYDKLVAGTRFEEILAQSTQNEDAIRARGQIGWRQLSAFPSTIQPDLQAAKAGSYTKPVQTVNGIQIFRVDMKGAEAKDDELTQLKTLYGRAYLERLKSEAKVERVK